MKFQNNCLYNFLIYSASSDSISMNVGLFESSEPAESDRTILVLIGLMVVEILASEVRAGKSEFSCKLVIISLLFH